MTTKIDRQLQPRDSADGPGEVALAQLREQFERSFVPRMSEDGADTPMVTPKITEMVSPRVTPMVIPQVTPKVGEMRTARARIAGAEMKVTGSSSLKIIAGSTSSRTSFSVTPGRR